ncbi:MAG: peptidoglycan-associated lipoprotein Pal [Rhodospirillales bacterium]|nr:peptidoglycan-associated lipoprotein Pal [Rhodospirillales bacterium]
MLLKKLAIVVAGLFFLAACEATTGQGQSSGSGAASGAGGAGGAGGASGAGAIVAGSSQDFVINVGDRVFFDFDKSNIRADQHAALQRQAAWLKMHPSQVVALEGHADERGTREYNLALGERRANSAKDFLVALGVSPNRLKTISYGKERPVALGHDEAAWKQNRRAVTVVTGSPAGS